PALIAASAAMAAGALFGVFLPMPDVARDDLSSADNWQEPVAALELVPNSGPVHIEISYRIGEADREAFRRAMVERRRIRRRNGAQHWTLLQDIHDPERWVERYQTPRWIDYIRHNLRRTKTDAALHERLLALHRGPEAPVIHRYLGRPGPYPPPHEQERP